MSNLKILEEKIKNCKKCQLYKTRNHAVPGEGDIHAKIMFIGEGPGANEDKNGVPFCGAAGKLLSELLNTINLNRKDVYITNVVKCRPPKNRDPLQEEVEACWPFLEKQIELIKPKIFILLGRHALDRFIKNRHISSDHGKVFRKELRKKDKIIYRIFFPVYHPAAALYNPNLKQILNKDFSKIPKILEKISQGEIVLKKNLLESQKVANQEKLI